MVNQWMQKGWRERLWACFVCDAHPVTRQVSRVQVSLERHTTADQSGDVSYICFFFFFCLATAVGEKQKT